MSQLRKTIGYTGASLTLLVGLAAPALTLAATGQQSSSSDPSTYRAALHPLNRSGVTGLANLSLNSTQPGASLTANVDARGAEPSQIHAMHIHGKLDGGDAECPVSTADTNHDRLISVFEGAPFYGPIKVSFTSPATTFGPPSRTDLFAPFAGIPVASNFPMASSSGHVRYDQMIPFDASNQYAVQALASLTPLSDQHIVIHGGFAPESVDTPGGDPNKIVYDGLLPIACGSIVQTHQGSVKNHSNGSNGDSAGGNGSASISNTGPDSNNRITQRSDSRTTIENTNNVSLSSSNNQSSTSGNATARDNTRSGDVSTGSARNQSSNSWMIHFMNSMLGIR